MSTPGARASRRALRPLVVACATALAVTAPARAQIADTGQVTIDSVIVTPEATPTVVPVQVDTVLPVTPRGAFIRSAILPGWGQAKLGSYVRGGVFFAGWAANNFMLFRNQVRLDQARGQYDRRVDQLRSEMLARAEDPAALDSLFDAQPQVLVDSVRTDQGPGATGDNLWKLVRAREQQREDWIAWSIFWVLASGLDGFVTAHLADFPAEIDVSRNGDRSISLGLQVALPVRKP